VIGAVGDEHDQLPGRLRHVLSPVHMSCKSAPWR
jgi:hypothetical protein